MFCAIITFPLFEDAGDPGTFGKFSVTVTELVFSRLSFFLSFFHKFLKTWTWTYLKKGFPTPVNIVSFPVIVIKYFPGFSSGVCISKGLAASVTQTNGIILLFIDRTVAMHLVGK